MNTWPHPCEPFVKHRRDRVSGAGGIFEIERLRRFGEPRTYREDETIARPGRPITAWHLILSGTADVMQHALLGITRSVTVAVLVDVRARSPSRHWLFCPTACAPLLIAEAELGERVMRALILRWVSLITGTRDSLVAASAIARLDNFLSQHIALRTKRRSSGD